MTRLADDFDAIRVARDALARAHALEPDLPLSWWICRGIELFRHRDESWSGIVDGHPVGPYPDLSTALSAARSLREPYQR